MITKAAIMLRAGVDLKKKLALEKQMMPDLDRVFAEERRLFRDSIRTASNQADRVQMRRTWRRALDKHHALVSKTFAKGFNPTEATVLSLEREIAALGKERTADIVKTSVKDMRVAKARAIDALVADKITPTPDLIQRTGSKLLKRAQKGRLDAISVTETQSSAETTKGILSTDADGERVGEKTWVIVRDSKTRPSHIKASGQKRATDKPFSVGDSKLRWPGDSKLGAKIKELVYCRCNAIYS